jgi:hypothetical protein
VEALRRFLNLAAKIGRGGLIVLRKTSYAWLAAAACLLLAVPALAYLADGRGVQVDVYREQALERTVFFAIGVPKYWVVTPDGKTEEYSMDTAPYVKPPGRTFVPVRFLGYALGVAESDVTWEPGTGKVGLRLAGNELGLQIGSKTRMRNGRADEMDVAPELVYPGRTMLPARFVAEGLGYQVDWDASDQLVLIWPAGQPKPEIPEQVLREARKAKGDFVWTTVGGVALPDPAGPGVKLRLSGTYYVLDSGLGIRSPEELDNKWCMLYVPNREWLDDARAYDHLYQILFRTFGDEGLAREVRDYVRENKPDRRTEIPEKMWRVPDGREIWVSDAGMDARVEIKLQ